MPITGRNDIMKNIAKGLGFFGQFRAVGPAAGNTTAAALASGSLSVQLQFNSIGSTLPTTLVGFQLPPTLSNELFFTRAQANNNVGAGWTYWVARLYKIGTMVLSATGDQFTHDAATFPVLRTQFGEASKPLSLLPIIYLTVATQTTAPVISLRTAAGGAGYVDQDGNSTIGTASNFTFPNAITAIESAFVLRLNDGDSGVRDISAIQVVTASGGAGKNATIFGVELIAPLSQVSDQTTYCLDAVFGGLAMYDLEPAAATSGTVTSYLIIMSVGKINSGAASNPSIAGVLNV